MKLACVFMQMEETCLGCSQQLKVSALRDHMEVCKGKGKGKHHPGQEHPGQEHPRSSATESQVSSSSSVHMLAVHLVSVAPGNLQHRVSLFIVISGPPLEYRSESQ